MTIIDTSTADVAAAEEIAASSRVSLFRRLLHRPLAVISLLFIAIVVFCTIFASAIAPYSPTATDMLHTLRGPSSAHWLGTDGVGRDVLSRLIYGGRVSLLGMVIAVGTALVIGVPAGLIAGYAAGRWPDSVVEPGDVETNIVLLRPPDPAGLLAHLEAEGVRAGMVAPGVMRLVTHADVDDAAVELACKALLSAP